MNIRNKFYTNMNVTKIEFNQSSNTFNVETTNTASDEVLNETFDYVAVATVHFSVPHDPHFQGEETFTGQLSICLIYF